MLHLPLQSVSQCLDGLKSCRSERGTGTMRCATSKQAPISRCFAKRPNVCVKAEHQHQRCIQANSERHFIAISCGVGSHNGFALLFAFLLFRLRCFLSSRCRSTKVSKFKHLVFPCLYRTVLQLPLELRLIFTTPFRLCWN